MVNKKLLPYILSLSLIIPSVLAENPTVRSGLTGFANGFRGLFQGNTGSFVDGLIAAAPVIGLFVVVFGLMFFLTKITLFKDEEHSKYARMIAIGIGLIGIAQQSVFNAILGWSTTFLTLAFILFMIFMFIIFLNHSRKNHYHTSKEMYAAQSEFFSSKSDAKKARKDLNKVTHELELDSKLYTKAERDLASLNSDLQDLDHLRGDELRQVDNLANLLRKASAAANRGETNQVHAYVQALTREIGALVTTMQHEGHDDSKARKLLNDIREHLAYAFKDEKTELSEEEHLKKILKRHLEHVHKLSGILDDKKVEELVKRIMRSGTNLYKHLTEIRNSAIALRNLEDDVEKYSAEMAKFGYQAKQDAAAAVRDAAMTQDFTEAHKQLDYLRSLIEQGRKKENEIHSLESNLLPIVRRIKDNEKALANSINSIRQDIEDEIEEETEDLRREKTKERNLLREKKILEANLKNVLSSSRGLSDALRNFEIQVEHESKVYQNYNGDNSVERKLKNLRVQLVDILNSGIIPKTNELEHYILGLFEGDYEHSLKQTLVFIKSYETYLSSFLTGNLSSITNIHFNTIRSFDKDFNGLKSLVKSLKADIKTAKTYIESEIVRIKN